MAFTFTHLRRIICCGIFFIGISSFSQPALTYTQVISGFDFPVDILNAHDGSDRLFIVEQGGVIKTLKNGVVATFIDLSGLVPFNVANEERGVLSMVFHPGFNGTSNRYFFIYYTTTDGSGTTFLHVDRYQTVPGHPETGDASTHDEVIVIDKTTDQKNHNGGKLNFGADGMLYFGTGDGGGGNDPNNLAQSGNSYMGKMLRIDINGSTPSTPFYSIPSGNPYAATGDGILDEIWATGLRNPFRWSFDPVTNAMWIGDVGQGQREEVDVRPPSPTTGGVNYGWHCYEGTLQPPPGITACNPLPANYVAPIFEYGHNISTGGFAITGGYVYRGTVSPALYGYYVFSDYVSGNVWVMNQSGTATQQTNDLNGVTAFGLDEENELYAVTRGDNAGEGSVYRISSSTIIPLPITLLNFTGKAADTYNELRWVTSYESNADKYIIEYSTDGINFLSAGETAATNNPTGSNYSFRHLNPGNAKLFYRLQLRDRDGTFRYSSVITIGGNNTAASVRIYPTMLNNNKLEITSNINLDQLKVFDIQGKQFAASSLNGRQGYFSIQLPNLSKGIYFVKIEGKDFTKTERVVVQ